MEEEGNTAGRPSKYNEEYEKQVYKLCLLGADDQEIADFFEVNKATINRWKKDHKGFCASIKNGKQVADMNVAHSLYDRAIGFEYDEVKEEQGSSDTGGAFQKTVTTTKKVVGDVRAQQLWLMNRQRNKWTDTKHVDHTTNGESITTNQPLQVIITDMTKKADADTD